ncbi:hypothetical protein HK104_009347 [Borealophlyctis nickersoniae]|nr:hypothetical protein HK104_009347 [Borealophlyctis nickersoniae]
MPYLLTAILWTLSVATPLFLIFHVYPEHLDYPQAICIALLSIAITHLLGIYALPEAVWSLGLSYAGVGKPRLAEGKRQSPVSGELQKEPFDGDAKGEAAREVSDGGVEEKVVQSAKESPAASIPNGKLDHSQSSMKADDPYIHLLEPLTSTFLTLADTNLHPSSPTPSPETHQWHTVLTSRSSTSKFGIEIHKFNTKDFCFRYIVEMEATPEEAFDFLADIGKRPLWDETCESGGIVEKSSPTTTVQYFRTKGMWPTSPREALVVSFVRTLPDGRYLNVTQSIPSHPLHNPADGHVRMLATIAGQIVGPDPLGRPGMCRVVQVVDGDLGGWLPKKVVSFVTTQAIPVGMGKANKMMREANPQKTVSVFAEEAQKGSVAGAGTGATDRPATSQNTKGAAAALASGSPRAVHDLPPSSTSSRAVAKRPSQNLLLAPTRNRYKVFLRILRQTQPLVFLGILFAIAIGRWRR